MDQKEIDHAQILNTISQIEDKYIDNHSYVGKKNVFTDYFLKREAISIHFKYLIINFFFN
jgi:hypothetical protein